MKRNWWMLGLSAAVLLGIGGMVWAQTGGTGVDAGAGGTAVGGGGGVGVRGGFGRAHSRTGIRREVQGQRRGPDGLLYTVPARHEGIPENRAGTPDWKMAEGFHKDTFTFARMRWTSWKYGDAYLTDYPECDLNFSFRFRDFTSFKVNPTPVILSFTDDQISAYPMVYMEEVATLVFSDEEVAGLRKYLLNGGFLLVDDFWGVDAWKSFHEQMKRVLPDLAEPKDLPLEHPIFHCVFDLKIRPQIPGIEQWARWGESEPERTWEREDARTPEYWAYFDNKGRMMALICHNTDLGDGWQREGDSREYFERFSEKLGYPMGVNIVFYVMTH